MTSSLMQIDPEAGHTKGTKRMVQADPTQKVLLSLMANDVIGVSGKVDLDKLGSFLTMDIEQGLKAVGIYDTERCRKWMI